MAFGPQSDGGGRTMSAARSGPRVRELAETFVRGVILNRDQRRRIVLRKAFFAAARKLTPSVAVQHEGACFLVGTGDHVVGRETFANGAYELDVMQSALELLERRGHGL